MTSRTRREVFGEILDIASTVMILGTLVWVLFFR